MIVAILYFSPLLIIPAALIAALWYWPMYTLCALAILGVYLLGTDGGYNRGRASAGQHPRGVEQWGEHTYAAFLAKWRRRK